MCSRRKVSKRKKVTCIPPTTFILPPLPLKIVAKVKSSEMFSCISLDYKVEYKNNRQFIKNKRSNSSISRIYNDK